MIRTQIQLPDDVYNRAREIASQREISLAELTRRGLEYMLSVYSPSPQNKQEWHPPTPRGLGWRGLDVSQLKEEAQRSHSEEMMARSGNST